MLRILDEFRACDLSNDAINFVKTTLSRPLNMHPFDVVRLFSHKDKVREENDKFLDMLPGSNMCSMQLTQAIHMLCTNAQLKKNNSKSKCSSSVRLKT